MEDDNNNILLKLLKCELKPKLSHYTLDQLTNMYMKLNNNKENSFNEIKNILSQNTLSILENIFNNVVIVDINKIETENKKKILIDWIEDFWTKLPLLYDVGDIVECGICLNYINKNDYTIFKCNHIIHTTCFLNYLLSNLKNNSYIDESGGVEKLFRCPNCRIFLTDMAKKSFEQNEYVNEVETNDEYIIDNNYNNIDQIYDNEYGDEHNNLILQEYNLIANLLDNNTINNIFRMSNNIGFGSNVRIDYNERNITQATSLSSSEFSISSSSSSSSSSDSDEN